MLSAENIKWYIQLGQSKMWYFQWVLSTPFCWCGLTFTTLWSSFYLFHFFLLDLHPIIHLTFTYQTGYVTVMGKHKSFKYILCIKSLIRDINLPMMKKQALTSTPPDSTCSMLLCWLFPDLLITLSWSVSGWVQKFASTRPLRNRKMEPYRAQREVSSFAVQMDST